MVETQILIQEIRSLKRLTHLDKAKMVVTIEGSRYEDSTWSYFGEIEQRNIKHSQSIIRWNVDLENGKYLTDSIYSKLLESAKDFVLSLRLGQTRRSRAPKATTVLKTHKCLIPLFRWMASEDILEFSSLDSIKVMKYLTKLQTSISRYGKPLSEGEIFKRLEVIDQLWKQSEFITYPLQQNPFPYDTPYQLSGVTKTKQQERKFDFIPDEVALELGAVAVDYLEKRSGGIIMAAAAVEQVYNDTLQKYSTAEADRRARKVANSYGYKYVKEVTKEIGYLRTACYIVVALFSGIRDSEISSLDIGCVENDSEGGYTWINGYVYKTAAQKIKSRWMVPPIVGVAVKVAISISEKYREEINSRIIARESDIKAPLTKGPKLDLLKNEYKQLQAIKRSFWLNREISRGNSTSCNGDIHRQLKEFIIQHNVPMHDGKPWNLHPHQFRRTFVRFMVKNAMNLKYLQEHFRHISLDMTAWYDIEDTELTKEIVDCYTEMSKEVLDGIVDGNNIAGKGGEIILQKRDEVFRGVIGKSRDHIIKAMADTVTLRSTGVSWCLGDIENGECSGVHGCMIDPSNVNNCSQAIVTPEFLPAWTEIKFRNQELLERDDLGVHQKQAIRNFLESVVAPVMRGLTESGT